MHRVSALIVAVVALLMLGAAPASAASTFTVQGATDPAVAAGFAQIDKQTEIDFTTGDCAGPSCIRVQTATAEEINELAGNTAPSLEYSGFTVRAADGTCVVYVSDSVNGRELPDRVVKSITMHEVVSHCLGAGENDDTTSVRYSGVSFLSSVSRLNRADVAAVNALA